MRSISFEEKVKKVLPDIKKVSFHEKYGLLFEHLMKLKEFRDDITHTKPNHNDSFNYNGIFIKVLDAEYESIILAAKDFINFHEPNLIEECDCGQDF